MTIQDINIITFTPYADSVLRSIPATSSTEWFEYLPSLTLSSFLLADVLANSVETWEDWNIKIKHQTKGL